MKNLFLLVVVLGTLCGCSTVKSMLPGDSTSAGDQMLSQSKQTKELGKTWKEGKSLVERGERLLSKSEKLALESQNAKVEAEGLIARGRSLISNSEQGYRTAFGADPFQAAER